MANTETEDVPPDKVYMMGYEETLKLGNEMWQVSRECADEMLRTIPGLREQFCLDQVTLGDGQCFATSIVQQLRRPEVNSNLDPRLQKLARACDPRALKTLVKLFMKRCMHSRIQKLKTDP